jgi:hypothetical protein
MDEALRDLLLNEQRVAAIVARRVDWGVRPQGDALPAITLDRISGIAQMNLAGPSGWDRDRVQIDCWARTYKIAKDLSLLIAGPGGLLVGYRGDHQGFRLRTFVAGRRSDADSDTKGPVHRTSVDVMVWHTPL